MLADDPRPRSTSTICSPPIPRTRSDHALRGNLAVKQKRFKRASKAFGEAARLDPRDQEIAGVARNARVAAHPLLAPVPADVALRPLALVLPLPDPDHGARGGAAPDAQGSVVICIWLVIVILSWFGPRILRRLEKRKYGGF